MNQKLDNKTLARAILTLTFSRLIINITRRFPYAFLPTIARQLSVPLSAVQSVMAIQAGVGMSSPVFGPLSERFGRKRVILGTLALLVVASLLGMALPQFQIFAVVMIAYGIAKTIFDPSVHAYVGDRVAYARRGVATGVIELSWAGSLLVAAPVAGIVLGLSYVTVPDALMSGDFRFITDFEWRTTGLQAIFGLLAVSGALAFFITWWVVPADHPASGAALRIITPFDTLKIIRGNPAAMGAVAYSLLLSTANEIFFINYGAWMELSFDLVLAALGAVTVVIAAAEVVGEVSIIALADRIGKRRLALLGSGISSACYLLLPLLDFSLIVALIGLFVMFLFVEIGIVASLPLFTEVLPESRAVMMSGVIGAASGGRLLGAILGGAIYALSGDFVVMGGIAMLIGFGSFFMLWRFVPEAES